MKEFLFILVGGGLGSILRYFIGELIPYYYKGKFPLGTFTADILGCLAIGIFSALMQPTGLYDAFFVTGFCGGFTTFSSFSKESFLFFHTKENTLALVYAISTPIFGLIAVLIGYTLAGGNLAIL
mgnify:CR=1 FL=1